MSYNKLLKNIKIKSISILMVFLLFNNVFAANVMHTFTDEEWRYINEEWKIMDTGLDIALNDGPGYEILKEKYDTNDFDIILNDVDKNYGLSDEEANIVNRSANMSGGSSNGDDIKLSARDKMLVMKEDGNNKKEEKRQEKENDDNDKEKGSMKVRIAINVDKNHPNNPTPGQTYNKVYIYYTDCSTLGEVLRENDLTSDVSFLSTLDGIEGSVTINESYSADFMHGTWEGYSFMLYKNGKQTNVGMEDLPITDGCGYRIKAEYQSMSW